MRWTLADAARACGADALGDAVVSSVVIDSRLAASGALFVALPGEHVDGHDFVVDAADRGAAALCSRGRLPGGVIGFEVEDTLAALRMLAEARRTELGASVVAVTGSSGKTTTKDFIAAVLGPEAHAAPKSFNNEIGVPLTVLGCPDGADALIVEVGSRGRGDIAHLAGVIRPDVAVITNIGRAHLETFGTVAGVLAAKWELVEALADDGVAVLPSGDERLPERHKGPVLTFGEDTHADVRVSDIALDGRGIASFSLAHGGAVVDVTLGVPGRHQPLNAAAAVAAALALGRSFSEAAGRLETAVISGWRMELFTAPIDGGEITVVNDAYNANPDSMTSALHTVAGMSGRRTAVLGKMYELGTTQGEAHREMGSLAASLGFEVVVVGDDPGIAAGAGDAAVAVETPQAAIDHLLARLEPGDVVLVKASRAAGLEAVAIGLQEVGV